MKRGNSKMIQETTVPWRISLGDIIEKYTEPGASLKGFRLRENLTQVELAKKLGITQGNLSAMERGRRPIGKTMALRLAKIFDTDYRIFL